MTFTIPNLLSLLRMGLVPLFIITVVNSDWRKALLIFLVAGITDALDGFIARFWNQKSLLGSYLDPIADKLLLTSAYVVLSIPGLNRGAEIPLWITILVIARDVLIVIMALVLYLAAGIRTFPPSILSKINTALQVAAVFLVLVSGTFANVELIGLVADTALYLVAGLTVASGLDYIYRYSRKQKDEA
jgi:cardiolipin synthase